MTSCNQLKDNFLLLLFHLIIVYFVRERFHLYIGIYIFMKSTFSFLIKKLRKLAKTPKFVLKKQNKTKKLRSNNKNNKKRIRMFWRETIALYCLLLFATTKQKEITTLFYRITSCSKNYKLPSFYKDFFAISTYSKAFKSRYNTTNIWQLFCTNYFFLSFNFLSTNFMLKNS